MPEIDGGPSVSFRYPLRFINRKAIIFILVKRVRNLIGFKGRENYEIIR